MRWSFPKRMRVLAAVALLALAQPAGAFEIALLPGLTRGPSPSLDLVVSGLGAGVAPSLGAFDVEITFDPAIVDVTAVAFGSGLGDPATETIHEWVDGAASSSLVSVSLLAPAVLEALQAPSFVLARLDLSLAGTEPTTLGFGDVLLGDAFGAPLTPVTTTGATVDPVIPEPSAVLVFGLGLLAVAARVRRRRS